MRIFNNLGYKIAALVLSVVFWGTAQGLRSVDESIDLAIALESTPEDLVVVGQSASEINVRLRGSRAALRRAVKEMDFYRLSLEGAKPPEARFNVTEEGLSLPRGSRMLFRSPSTVLVQLEPLARKRVPVRADLAGQPPAGYRILAVTLDPADIELAGARSEIRRIREVVTDRIDLASLRASQERDVRLLMGAGHVWRADDGDPRVRVKIEVGLPLPPPAPEPAGPEAPLEPQPEEARAPGRAADGEGPSGVDPFRVPPGVPLQEPDTDPGPDPSAEEEAAAEAGSDE